MVVGECSFCIPSSADGVLAYTGNAPYSVSEDGNLSHLGAGRKKGGNETFAFRP